MGKCLGVGPRGHHWQDSAEVTESPQVWRELWSLMLSPLASGHSKQWGNFLCV